MKFKRLSVFLPCHSLEDLSLQRTPQEADELLSAWSAVWHPALVAAADALPAWSSAEYPPDDPADHLILVPPLVESLVPKGWWEKAAATNAVVLRNLGDRPAITAALLALLEPETPVVPLDVAADFWALGIAYLFVELLTRQLRYMSNLDETALQGRTVAAATAALAGEFPRTTAELQSAFDLLQEAREYFYPSEANLLDLTLVTPTLIGAPLRSELSRPTPTNLMLDGQTLELLARDEPETLRMLQEGLAAGRVALVGGEPWEEQLPLLPPEALAAHLQRGRALFERHLGQSPSVFGRRRFGLTPVLPQIVRHLGYEAGLHFTLDDGRFPTTNQSRIRWEGLDGTALEVLSRVPLDAHQADTFLRLPEKLGEILDLDHVGTLVFAHWAGHAAPWYDDLQRAARLGSALGRFALLTEYFRQSALSGQATRHPADKYKPPYLRQDVEAGRRDPLSRYARFHRRRALFEAGQTLRTMQAVLTRQAPAEEVDRGQLSAQIAELLAAPEDHATELDARLAAEIDTAAGQLATTLTGATTSAPLGWLAVNPLSFTRSAVFPKVAPEPAATETSDATAEAAQAAAATAAKGRAADVPGLGFHWASAAPPPAPPPVPQRSSWFGWRKKRPPAPPPAEEFVLRNEFFEVTINPTSGGVEAVSDYTTRGSRLSQQIGLRTPQPRRVVRDEWGNTAEDPNSLYSIMAADEVSPAQMVDGRGTIVSRGRLMSREGQVVARFVQTTQVTRGSRVLKFNIELDPLVLPEGDPWKTYYALRFAWQDEAATIYRSVNMASRSTENNLFESPLWVDVRSDKLRTTILPQGLPYHRRNGLRMLDTLLIVAGETARRFDVGVAFDAPAAAVAAIDDLTPATVLADRPAPSAHRGWLFHLDRKSVIATHWEPIVAAGQVAGFRVRLLETEGRGGPLALRCFRPVQRARRLAAPGEAVNELPLEGDRVLVQMGPYQWTEVECLWEADP